MVYSVELYLDKETEKKIISLAETLPASQTTQGSIAGRKTPHMTLGLFNDVEETRGEEKLKRLVRQWRKGEARFASVGFVPEGAIFLVPILNDFIYSVHLDLHENFRFSIQGHENYSFGSWMPHLTLARYAEDKETFLKAIQEAWRNFKPHSGSFERVALVRLGDKPSEVCSFKLRD